ncbi:hypothetical protein [Agromyces bauzanensis]
MKIRRTLTALVAAVGLALLGAGPAMAANGSPHFIGNATDAELSGTSLVVSFKEAGLAAGSTVNIEANATLSATYSCVNGGTNIPSDQKKTTISGEISKEANFTAGRNGNVVDSLTLSVPSAASQLDCPNGQTATLISGTWSNASVTDHTNNVSYTIGGSWSF